MKPSFPSKDEWDERGTFLVKSNSQVGFTFHDLTPLTAPVLPAIHPSGLHFYTMDRELKSTAYSVRSYSVEDIQEADRFLHEQAADSTIYLLCMFSSPHHNLTLRAAFVQVLPEYSYYKPMPPKQILQYLGEKKKDLSMYPHLCPFCGAKAFIGFNQVDCMEGCR